MKLAIVGSGYVGLTLGASLAEIGHDVICADVDADKIRRLEAGDVLIYEPGLSELVKRNHEVGRLRFTTDVARAIRGADVVYSAVGTPRLKNDKADLSAVRAVATTFGQSIERYTVFVNKSTVPVGTAVECKKIIAAALRARKQDIAFDVVSNPEFLREGNAVSDCIKPDRIIVGSYSDRARELLRTINKPLVEKGATLLETDVVSAELIKYASNALLATKISFMNEIARLAEAVGADVTQIERGVGLDSRIGRRFLHAGIGYGGSCFPKDVAALRETAKEYGYDFKIISAVQSVNDAQRIFFIDKIKKAFPKLRGARIALWGLSFKPKTDDVRDAPSATVIDELLKEGAEIVAYDPVAIENCKKLFPAVRYVESALDAVRDADALVLLTEWDEFRGVELAQIKRLMRGEKIFDGRNIWDAVAARQAGFIYIGVGR